MSEFKTDTIPQELKKGNRLVINIYGSAGAGKTTLAKNLQEFIIQYSKESQKYNKFAPELKPALVSEFATELINQGKFEELKNQPFVTRGQITNLRKAFEKSNLIITDSPLKLGEIYNTNSQTKENVELMIKIAETDYKSIDLFLKHDTQTQKTYSMQGRIHTYQESLAKEKELLKNLENSGIKPIFINRNMDLETIYNHISNTSEFIRFETNLVGDKILSSNTSKDKNKEIS